MGHYVSPSEAKPREDILAQQLKGQTGLHVCAGVVLYAPDGQVTRRREPARRANC